MVSHVRTLNFSMSDWKYLLLFRKTPVHMLKALQLEVCMQEAYNGSNRGSKERQGGRRPKKWPSVFLHFSLSFFPRVLKQWICYQVTRTKPPIPAPRQKKEQTSTGISHLVSSKTPDNNVAGNCTISIHKLRRARILSWKYCLLHRCKGPKISMDLYTAFWCFWMCCPVQSKSANSSLCLII
jgi:hypothetical protein